MAEASVVMVAPLDERLSIRVTYDLPIDGKNLPKSERIDQEVNNGYSGRTNRRDSRGQELH
jgi:hypothetical protein